MASRIKELVQNSLLFTIANLSSKVIVFLMVPFYTTVLSVDQFGDASIIQSTASFLYPIFTCLIAEAVLRFCFLKNANLNLIFSEGLKVVFFAGTISLLLAGIASLILSEGMWSVNLWFIPGILITYSASRLLHCFCRGINRVKISAIAGIIQTMVVVGINLILLGFYKFGVWAYLLSFVIGELSGALFLAIKIKAWRFISVKTDCSLNKAMLQYSLPLVPSQISWWALSCINQYIVLYFLGIGAVGIYTATLRIPSILTVLTDIFAQAWLLSALKDYDTKKTKDFIIKMSGLFFRVLIILSSLIIIISNPIAKTMLRGQFSDYWYIAPLLFISVYLGAITGFLGSIFSAERKNQIQAVSTMIGAIIAIAFAILLIRPIGIVAISLSTLIGYFSITIIRLWGTRKYIKLNINYFDLICQTAILVIESLFVMNGFYGYAVCIIILLITLNLKAITYLSYYMRTILRNVINKRL